MVSSIVVCRLARTEERPSLFRGDQLNGISAVDLSPSVQPSISAMSSQDDRRSNEPNYVCPTIAGRNSILILSEQTLVSGFARP
jgi:hypothetical protein